MQSFSIKGVLNLLVLSIVVSSLGAACSLSPLGNTEDVKHDSGKAIFEQIENEITPEEAIRLLGQPTGDLELEIGIWPAHNMSLWFDKDGQAQVYAPAFKFEYVNQEDHTGTLNIEDDVAFDQKMIAKYITAKASIDDAISEFGEPKGAIPYRYMYWDFPNGDRIVVLFNGLYNFEQEKWVFDYKLANLDRADMPGEDGEWDFMVFGIQDVPEPAVFAVLPKMLWTARGDDT